MNFSIVARKQRLLRSTQEGSYGHCTDLGHHVVFHGHGDDIQANDTGDGQIKIFAVDHCVDDEARS